MIQINFFLLSLKQMSMTVQVNPVRTMGPAQTEWTDLTAAAHQDLMGTIVKMVPVYFTLSLGDLGLSLSCSHSVLYIDTSLKGFEAFLLL